VDELAQLARSERRTTVSLIAHLAELDARRLHLRAGYPSLFMYCTQVLRLSEGGAYNRIVAARAARRFLGRAGPPRGGAAQPRNAALIAPHLNPENQERLFDLAAGKGKREVEDLLARVFPRPDTAPSIRRLPRVDAQRMRLEEHGLDRSEECARLAEQGARLAEQRTDLTKEGGSAHGAAGRTRRETGNAIADSKE
jgi:hypothetical protein